MTIHLLASTPDASGNPLILRYRVGNAFADYSETAPHDFGQCDRAIQYHVLILLVQLGGLEPPTS